MTYYLINLLYRWLFGISDLADRNFFVSNNIIYSIDEETNDKDIKFINELRKNKTEILIKWLNLHWIIFITL